MREVRLTTADNPYSPFDEPELWRMFDEQNGYCTNNYVARIAKTSIEMTDQEYMDEVERAIDEILDLNLTGNYKKVVRES